MTRYRLLASGPVWVSRWAEVEAESEQKAEEILIDYCESNYYLEDVLNEVKPEISEVRIIDNDEPTGDGLLLVQTIYGYTEDPCPPAPNAG